MELTVRFFARLRDELNCESLNVSLEQGGHVADLRKQLTGRASGWEVLAENNVLVAVNQQISNDDTELKAGDEVAFFPPVTGG